jgi:hypothetical protein
VYKKGGMVIARKREILRCAQDDSSGLYHPERSEGVQHSCSKGQDHSG